MKVNLSVSRTAFVSLSLLLASLVLPTHSGFADGGNMATAGIGKATPYASGGSHLIQPGTPQGRAEALVDSNFNKCGQDCLYLKANENITIQMDYILKKVQFLDDPDPSVTESSKRAALAGFCGKPNGEDEDIDDCIDRYKQVNKFWLLKARGALGKHDTAIANLQCTKFDQVGNCLSAPIAAPQMEMRTDPTQLQKTLLPHVGHYAKASELGLLATRQAVHKVQTVTDNTIWTEGMYNSLEPKVEDFIQFRRIPRNPSNRAEGTIEVPVMKGNGTLEYDLAAYQAAHDEWSGIAGGAAKAMASKAANSQPGGTPKPQQAKGTPQGLRATIDATTRGQKIHQVIEKNKRDFQNEFATTVNQGDVQTKDEYVSRRLYSEARGENVDALNDFVKNSPQWAKGKTNTANFGSSGQAGNQQQYKPTFQRPANGYTGEEPINLPAGPPRERYSITWGAAQIVPTVHPKTGTPSHDHISSSPPGTQPSNGLGGVVDSNQGDSLNLNF